MSKAETRATQADATPRAPPTPGRERAPLPGLPSRLRSPGPGLAAGCATRGHCGPHVLPPQGLHPPSDVLRWGCPAVARCGCGAARRGRAQGLADAPAAAFQQQRRRWVQGHRMPRQTPPRHRCWHCQRHCRVIEAACQRCGAGLLAPPRGGWAAGNAARPVAASLLLLRRHHRCQHWQTSTGTPQAPGLWTV